jgi:hypothetical protein
VRTLIAVTVALVLALPACAYADLPRPYEERVHVDTPCPDGGGTCAPSPDIYLEPGATRFMLWHERAHLFDAQVMTDAHRALFARLLGMNGAWYQGTGRGTRGPSEVFADAYAACATGNRPGARRLKGGFSIASWTTSYGYHPTPREHRLVCNAIGFLSAYASGTFR